MGTILSSDEEDQCCPILSTLFSFGRTKNTEELQEYRFEQLNSRQKKQLKQTLNKMREGLFYPKLQQNSEEKHSYLSLPPSTAKTQQKQSERIQLPSDSLNIQSDQQKIMERIRITDSDRKKGQKHMFKKYCKIFQLDWNSTQDKNIIFEDLRQKYKQLIYEYHHNQTLRKCINQGYQIICQKIFDVSYNQKERRLIMAIVQQDQNDINDILAKNPQMINFRLKITNYPLLYFAVRTGSYQITNLLLSKNVKFDFSSDKSTPMHCAAYYGFANLISLLVEHGIPLNIPNSSGNIPIEQARDQKIKTMIQNAQKDRIHQFITKLTDQGLYLKTFNIEDKFQVIAKKIILKSYQQQINDDYVDTFHGTRFQYLHSIAKYGLKKPGQKAGDKTIEILDGHIKNSKWAHNVFVSPSIFYAGCPVYSKKKKFLNTIKNKTDIWLPMLQVRVKKDVYRTSKSTTPSHKPLKGQPQQIEYIISYNNQEQARQKFSVVALIFVKKWYLKKKKVYHEATEIILNSPQEQKWKLSLAIKS